MKVKLLNAINLCKVYQEVKDQILPIKTTYKFTKLFDVSQKESKFYDTELNKLIAQYAELDEQNKPRLLENGGVQIKPDKIQIFQEKYNELWNLEIDFPNVFFNIEELERLRLSVENFNLLLPFIKE